MPRRLLRTWALDAVAHARALARVDATRGSETPPAAGGWLILSGRGMHVNRAIAVGIDRDLTSADRDLIVTSSGALGVDPVVEVTSWTTATSIERLRERGSVDDRSGQFAARSSGAPASHASRPP